MADYSVQLVSELKAVDGTCVIRLATSTAGQYVTITVKDGETISTTDPITAVALTSVSVGALLPIAKPTKPTYDVDKLTKAPLPQVKT